MKTNKEALQELVEEVSVYKKIAADYYKNKLPYSGKKADKAIRTARWEEEARLNLLFKSDLEKEFDIVGHPKCGLLFQIAWDLGHSSGYSEVWNYYQQLVDLIK